MKHIKLLGLFAAALLFVLPTQAQDEKKEDEKTYQFETTKEVPTTSVKDQYRSGTCWSFSGLSFLETELIRLGKGEFDLSEMFIVRKSYEEKAEKYVRMHGETNFGGGGAFIDVMHVYETYGICTEEAYKGLEYGTENHVHGELDNILKTFVDAVIENKNKELSTAWKKAYCGILDAYLGEIPESFKVNGETKTPKEFSNDLGLDMNDYVNITSYTHHPFYTEFPIEVQDNWMWADAWNLPMEEMMEVMDYAIDNGYSVAWGADVSEKGFSWTNGIAIVPATDRPDLDGLERDKWEKLSKREKAKQLYGFDKIVPEKEITQEMRQIDFDNYQTTDDHGMLIVGRATDQNGNKYFKVKNSWNVNNIYDGYFFASDAFVSYKTMNIIVHKDAIPKNIKKKLGIK